MDERYLNALSNVVNSHLSRRNLLMRAGLLGLGLPLTAGLLAACAEEDDAPIDGPAAGPDDDDAVDVADDDESADADEADDGDAPAVSRERLSLGVWTENSTLDPTRSVQTQNRFMFSQIFDPLIHQEYFPELESVPRLAESWEYTDDRTLRFHLREGVEFHNGEAFTAESVRLSLELYSDPTSQAVTKTTTIEEVNVIDDYTVDVVTFEPDPILIYDFHDGFFMIPPEHYQEVGPEEFANNPVGTGPFLFEQWVRGDNLTVSANPDYWGGEPDVQEVVFRFIPEDATRVAALQSGEIDIATSIPPALARELEGDDNIELTTAEDPAIIYVGFKWQVEDLRELDPAEEFLSDVRVRHALKLAVDKDAIVERLLFGYATKANQTAFPGAIGYNSDIPEHHQDLDRARELLAEAGYPDGFDGEITMGGPIGLVQASREVLQSIAGDWAQIGVNVSINMVEIATWSGDHLNSPDRENLEHIHMHRKAYPSLDVGQTHATAWACGFDWNYNRYCNERVDELVHQQGTTLDLEEREQIMFELAEVLYEDAPYVWIYFADWVVGTRNGVRYQSRHDGIVHAQSVEFS